MSTASRSVPATAEDPAIHAPARLAELARLRLATADDDDVLRALARTAAERLAAPTALINVVYDDAVGVLSAHGLDGWIHEAGGVPIEWSFCRYPVAQGTVFAVGDLAQNPTTQDNPLVTIDGVRTYAGAPLVTARGERVGALCVLGGEPRRFSDADLVALRALADAVVRYLEARAATADAARGSAPHRVA
ncbi:MAG TPA: GAF domain-containing protein [Gemmatirosa sp.]